MFKFLLEFFISTFLFALKFFLTNLKVVLEPFDAAFEIVFASDELSDGAGGKFFDFVGLVARDKFKFDATFDFFDGVSRGDEVDEEEDEKNDVESYEARA